MLIQTARDYAFGFDGEAEERMNDGNPPDVSGSGKGGIRTLEGALHPLPA